LSAREFSLAYYRLAKRYHPDHGNNAGHDLMANIKAGRTTILNAAPAATHIARSIVPLLRLLAGNVALRRSTYESWVATRKRATSRAGELEKGKG
jgi:hypothetical protein